MDKKGFLGIGLLLVALGIAFALSIWTSSPADVMHYAYKYAGGTRLPSPTPTVVGPTPTPYPTATFTLTPVPSPTPRLYVVQPGDTLISIARRFGVDVGELARINDIADPSAIIAGQVLIIPSPLLTPTATLTPTPVPTLTPTPTSPPTATPTPTLIPGDYYAVAEAKGPRRIRAGESVFIEVIASLKREPPAGSLPIPLDPNREYTATVRVQAGGLAVDKVEAPPRTLSVTRPARWPWVVSSQRDRLGDQVLVFEVFVYDEGRLIGEPYARLQVTVTTWFGAPAWLGYLLSGLLGAMGVILPLAYQEWSKREAQKRAKKRKLRRR